MTILDANSTITHLHDNIVVARLDGIAAAYFRLKLSVALLNEWEKSDELASGRFCCLKLNG